MNSQDEYLTYNLPGYGLLKTRLYPYTQAFFDFLKNYEYDKRFYSIDHLGAIRDIFQGLHNTRYEYIFVQWAFISELIKNEENKGLGLSKGRKEFGRLPNMQNDPSGAEVLQCLILLTNMGHLPGTFAASRAWLHRLKQDSQTRNGFRSGLEETSYLDKVLSDFDTYRIHLINAQFLLQRYRKFNGYESGRKFVDFGNKIICSYLDKGKNDGEAVKNLWSLYKVIRQVSYLVLDLHYTPVPLSLDLRSIILNFNQLFQQKNLYRESTFQLTLERLNNLLQDSLYMSSESLLAQSRRSEEIVKRLAQENSEEHKWRNISTIKELLEHPSDETQLGAKTFQIGFLTPDWDRTKTLELSYGDIENLESAFPQNIVEWEMKSREKIGKQFCRVAAQYNPPKSLLRVVYSFHKNIDEKKSAIKSVEIINQVLIFEQPLDKNYHNPHIRRNYENIFNFLTKAIFGWQTQVILKAASSTQEFSPFLSGSGVKKLTKEINSYSNRVSSHLSNDDLHEIKTVSEVLERLNLRSKTLVFLGSTRIKEEGDPNEKAEFDGIIFFPALKPSKYFAVIVEAKNQKGGSAKAEKVLNEKLERICPDCIQFSIEKVDKGAYAVISLVS